MPINIRLTKDLTKREVPDCTPEKAVREYFLSKCEESYEKKKTEWDIPRFSPATELIAKQRELVDAQARLKIKHTEESSHRQELDKRWEELREEENKLRESFVKFNQFVKENQEKRERAERKLKEEKLTQKRRLGEISTLKEQTEYLTHVKEKMHKHVQAYKIYENFLESVVASSDDFQSIYDVLTRHEILTDTRAELTSRQVKDLEEMEDIRNEITHLDEVKEQILMGINNEMAELQTKYDEAKQNSLRWETILGRMKTLSVDKKRELAQVKTCCWNLYNQVRNSRPNISAKSQDDVEGQLVEIKDALRVLKRVVQVAQQRAAAEIDTEIAEPEIDEQKRKEIFEKKLAEKLHKEEDEPKHKQRIQIRIKGSSKRETR